MQHTSVGLKPAPYGPLLGDELALAIESLTPKQLRAYRYRREGHTWEWIGKKMGTSHVAPINLVAKAEKRLGYEPTVKGSQKSPYKSVAERQKAANDVWTEQAREAIHSMTSSERRRLLKQIDPFYDVNGMTAGEEIRELARAFVFAAGDPDASERLRSRLKREEHARHKREREDDWTRTAGQDDEEFAASLEADFGMKADGTAYRVSDFSKDDGKGYDVA